MIIKVFSVYDDKAKAYFPPFFMCEEGQAIRYFKDLINTKDHHYSKNPADYTLFLVGSFDDEIGHFDNLVPNKDLGLGIQFRVDIVV